MPDVVILDHVPHGVGACSALRHHDPTLEARSPGILTGSATCCQASARFSDGESRRPGKIAPNRHARTAGFHCIGHDALAFCERKKTEDTPDEADETASWIARCRESYPLDHVIRAHPRSFPPLLRLTFLSIKAIEVVESRAFRAPAVR